MNNKHLWLITVTLKDLIYKFILTVKISERKTAKPESKSELRLARKYFEPFTGFGAG